MNRLKFIDYTKKIYFDKQMSSFIITDPKITKKILNDKRFTSNRIKQKVEGQFSPKFKKIEDAIVTFFNHWLIENHMNNSREVGKFLATRIRSLKFEKIIENEFLEKIIIGDKDLSDIGFETTCEIMSSLFNICTRSFHKNNCTK